MDRKKLSGCAADSIALAARRQPRVPKSEFGKCRSINGNAAELRHKTWIILVQDGQKLFDFGPNELLRPGLMHRGQVCGNAEGHAVSDAKRNKKSKPYSRIAGADQNPIQMTLRASYFTEPSTLVFPVMPS